MTNANVQSLVVSRTALFYFKETLAGTKSKASVAPSHMLTMVWHMYPFQQHGVVGGAVQAK